MDCLTVKTSMGYIAEDDAEDDEEFFDMQEGLRRSRQQQEEAMKKKRRHDLDEEEADLDDDDVDPDYQPEHKKKGQKRVREMEEELDMGSLKEAGLGDLKKKAKLYTQLRTMLLAHDDALEGPTVPYIAKDQTFCEICQREMETPRLLKRHTAKFHKKKTKHMCEEPGCDKIFLNKYSLDAHMKEHREEFIHCEVQGCKGQFTTERAYKKHKKDFHTVLSAEEMQKRICPFCTKESRSATQGAEHRAQCQHNPNRIEIPCGICKRVFYLQKYVNRHLRDEHGQ